MTTTSLRRGVGLATALVLAVAVLGGCGEAAPVYDAAVARQLQTDVDLVRAAAEQHDADDATAALNLLTRHVADAQASGQLSGEKARAILRAADLVAADVEAFPTPTPTPTAKPEPKPAPKKPAKKRPKASRPRQRQHDAHRSTTKQHDAKRSKSSKHDKDDD